METWPSITFANFVFTVHSAQSGLTFASEINSQTRSRIFIQGFADRFFTLTRVLPTGRLIKLTI